MNRGNPNLAPKTTNIFVGSTANQDIKDGDQPRESAINDDKIKGQWKQLADRAKAKWGKLTDDDLKIVDGNQEYLTGMVQERYSITKDEAKKQVEEFGRTL